MSIPASSPSGPTRALADLAFGSRTHVLDTSRPLAWLSPDELAIDLNDPAQRRFGDYELVEQIGQGGMGVVYRARQHGLERDVALKLLAAGPWASAEFVERFRREAKSAARMQHPNIVEIYEFGHRDGLNYFSMRLIDGQSLAEKLQADGAMEPKDAAKLLRTLAEAMDYAHRLGVLHLDLKPANVLLTKSGEPLIADFGLARRIDAGHEGGSEISGTPSYMAPEQAQLESHPLTASTDIYGLGAILYECLTGRPPFIGGSAQSTLERVVSDAPLAPRQIHKAIPADLEAICIKCLEKDPAQRYESARQLGDDLRRFASGELTTARKPGLIERTQRWVKQNQWATVTLAVVVIGMASTTWQGYQAQQQRQVAEVERARAEQQQRLAEAERDRATIAGSIGAWLFTQNANSQENDKRAGDLVAWLRDRLPGDEARQADALTSFATSVREADDDNGALFELLTAVVTNLGMDYRRQMFDALTASTSEDRHLHAALLSFYDDFPQTEGRFPAAMRSAIATQPDDPLAWHMVATYCPLHNEPEPCSLKPAGEQLIRIEPENMYHWLVVLMESREPARRREALRRAARSEHFNDYFSANYTAYFDAVRNAAVPVPPLLAGPIRLFGEDQSPQDAFAALEASNSPMPAWFELTRFCLPAQLSSLDAQMRADCLTVGTRLFRSGGALLSRMIGVAIVLPLARDTPLADEARNVRREYEYVKDATFRLPAHPENPYSAERFTRDIASIGELAAWQRRLEYYGVAPKPPADWQPEDGYRLMSARERIDNTIAAHANAAALLAQGRHVEAAVLLLQIEDPARRFFQSAHAWRYARYLQHLGQARLGLGEYAAAEKSLLEAWEQLQPAGPGSRDADECLRALIKLYEAWDRAEPGRGRSEKADEWRRRRTEFAAQEAATVPR